MSTYFSRGGENLARGGLRPSPWLRHCAQGSVFCKWAKIHYSR